MQLIDKLRLLDQRLALSTVGFFLSLAFSIFGIYTTFYYQKNPNLQFEIVSQDPVYDIKENISNLDIIYDNESIRQKGLMLSMIRIRVANTGNESLTKASFDEEALPKLFFQNGTILTTEITGTSSKYLQTHGKIAALNDKTIEVKPVIFDEGSFISFKALVIHQFDKSPVMFADGKIGGAPDIGISPYKPKESQSFLSRVFRGELLVQFVRATGYTLGTLLLLVISAFSASSLLEWSSKRKRRRFVSKFKKGTEIALSTNEKKFLDAYIERGEPFLTKSCDLLRDSEALNMAVSATHRIKSAIPSHSAPSEGPTPFDRAMIYSPNEAVRVAQFLLDHKVISMQEKTAVPDPRFLDVINRFESFVLALAPRKIIRRKPLQSQSDALQTEAEEPSSSPDE